jgi:hypothetical protein
MFPVSSITLSSDHSMRLTVESSTRGSVTFGRTNKAGTLSDAGLIGGRDLRYRRDRVNTAAYLAITPLTL